LEPLDSVSHIFPERLLLFRKYNLERWIIDAEMSFVIELSGYCRLETLVKIRQAHGSHLTSTPPHSSAHVHFMRNENFSVYIHRADEAISLPHLS
jgi:hypothetical protein